MDPLRDAALPAGCEPGRWAADGGGRLRAVFSAVEQARLLDRIAVGAADLRTIATTELLTAWDDALRALLDPSSPEGRGLRAGEAIAAGIRLSPAGLDAALDAVLGGLRRPSAERLADLIAARTPVDAGRTRAVYLAGNIPGLAAQPLLRGLLERRPMLLKSASTEPFFAPALVSALTTRLSSLATALTAVTWPHADRSFEEGVLARGFEIELYGSASAAEALAARTSNLLVHGPMASVALVSEDASIPEAARGLAEDIALFDQRGCLSVQAIYGVGPAERAEELARALAHALRELEHRLPPGLATREEIAGTQHLRADAEMRGLSAHLLAITEGTVVVEPRVVFLPSPGMRSVRVHPVPRARDILEALSPWAGRIQGVGTAGALAEEVATKLAGLGVTRLAPAGDLQRPDATWANWGERLQK